MSRRAKSHFRQGDLGWIRTRFGDIFELSYGKSLPKRVRNTNGEYPVYGSNGIVGYHDSFLVDGPVLVVGRKGTAGSVVLSSKPCWPIDTTYYVRERNHIDIRFSFYLLESLRLNQFDRSTAVPGLNRNDVYELTIDIPPLSEQHHIVAKIDQLFSELEAGADSLKKARAQLTTYRQAVLKHAFTGKLTAPWRERNGNWPSAEVLIQQILSKRRNDWESAKVRPPDAKVRARATNRKLTYRDPATTCSVALPEIPPSWCWTTVDQLLVDRLSNGRSVKNAQNGFPVLRLTALRNGEIEQDECKIGAWTEKDARKFLIREGDVLVSRGNGSLKLVGIGGLVRSLRSPVAYPDTMIRVQLSEHVHREFFLLVWNSQIVRRQIEEKARTTAGIFKVNQQDIKATLIPLPPREEQIAIAEAIHSGFAALDRASALVEYQVPNAMALRQSILKRALSGQLVRSNPEDAPASVLLGRIRNEREQVTKRKSSRKGKKRAMAGAKA